MQSVVEKYSDETKEHLSTFVVSSNKPEKLGKLGNEAEIQAIDEVDAISEFVERNGLNGKSSSHKFTAVLKSEDNRVHNTDRDEDEPNVVKRPTRKKKPAKKDE